MNINSRPSGRKTHHTHNRFLKYTPSVFAWAGKQTKPMMTCTPMWDPSSVFQMLADSPSTMRRPAWMRCPWWCPTRPLRTTKATTKRCRGPESVTDGEASGGSSSAGGESSAEGLSCVHLPSWLSITISARSDVTFYHRVTPFVTLLPAACQEANSLGRNYFGLQMNPSGVKVSSTVH